MVKSEVVPMAGMLEQFFDESMQNIIHILYPSIYILQRCITIVHVILYL